MKYCFDMASLKAFIFSIFVVFIIVVGILNVITNVEENRCEMTWMFEQPEYIKVPMPRAVNKKFPNYGLYIYGEGSYAKMLTSMKMTGIPVLFIPGNAGSYKQVRSLASVAFRKAIDLDKRFHFTFYSVNLNDELSGLYGSVLGNQTEFVNIAISKIFSLYKEAEVKPSTIILVGHSMGGMIARGLFTLPDFNAKQVNTIFMQATPNQNPVVVLDAYQAEYHRAVNNYWKANLNSSLSHITLVSIGGGDYDIQVRGGLTLLDGVSQLEHSISASTPHIPKSWVSTDHRCIVWCKQVVLATVRSMFDIVDENLKKVTDDAPYRMSVFKHHFLQHPGTIRFVYKYQQEMQLKSTGDWIELNDQVFKWEKDELKTETYLSIPLKKFEKADHVVVVSNILDDNWICACELKEKENQCTTCSNLSPEGNVIPPLNSNKKVVHIDLGTEAMARMTHIVVIVKETNKPVEVISQVYTQDKNYLSNTVPGMFEVFMSLPESVTKGALILDLGHNMAFYKLKLYNLDNVLKVYKARLDTSKCTYTNTGDYAGSVMRFHVPWSNEDTYQFLKYKESGNMTLKVQFVPQTPIMSPNSVDLPLETQYKDYSSVELFLYLDPTCSYILRISISFGDMMGQFIRFYGYLMPTFCVAVLMMTLVHQLRTLAKDGYCPSVLSSIWQIKPYYVIPFALILQTVLQLRFVQTKLNSLSLPEPDVVTLDRMGIWFRGIQLLLYFLALALTTFQAAVVYLVLEFISRLLGLLLGWLPGCVSKLGTACAVIFCLVGIGLAAIVCGSLGMLVCYVVIAFQLVQLCYKSRQSADIPTQSRYHFYQTLFMLWLWLLTLNSPPLIVFGKSVQDTGAFEPLTGDPSRITGTVAALNLLVFIVTNAPMISRSFLKVLSYVIHVLVVQMLVFGMLLMYRISYTAVATFTLVAISQLIGTVLSKAIQRPKTD